jgi:GINS complex protein
VWLFMAEALVTVDDIDFDFENSQVRVVLTHEIPEASRLPANLRAARLGQETEVPYWIASELVQLGYARFREEDIITYNSLSKIHWRETIPSSRQLPSLPGNYYCIMRRHLAALRLQSKQDQIKLRELEKTETLVRDIVNCRVRKIVSIAASPTPSEELIQGLTFEERSLYRVLNGTIEEWKARLLGETLKA